MLQSKSINMQNKTNFPKKSLTHYVISEPCGCKHPCFIAQVFFFQLCLHICKTLREPLRHVICNFSSRVMSQRAKQDVNRQYTHHNQCSIGRSQQAAMTEVSIHKWMVQRTYRHTHNVQPEEEMKRRQP